MNLTHYVCRLAVVGALSVAACGGDKANSKSGPDDAGSGPVDEAAGEDSFGAASSTAGRANGHPTNQAGAAGSGDGTPRGGAAGTGATKGEDAAGTGATNGEEAAGTGGTSTSHGGDSGDAGKGGGIDGGQLPKTYAELCPHATPNVGVPEPVGGAKPQRLHALYEYLMSPIATVADFGLASAEQMDVVESEPDAQVRRIEGFGGVEYRKDTSQSWPEWLDYQFDGTGGGRHVVTVRPIALQRGTYHITVPLKRWVPSPIPHEADTAPLQLVVRVRGLGFTIDRLPVGHYVGDTLDQPQWLTLAGGDLPWKVTDSPSWLQLSKTEGATLGSVVLEVRGQPALDELAVGHHEARLCVENARGDGATIPVFGLVERPHLRPLHTQRYLYNFASSEQLSSFTYVFTDLQHEVNWTASSSQPWLKLMQSAGTTNQRLDFTVDPTGLTEGRHLAQLTFADPSGKNDGTRVLVHYLKEPARRSSWASSCGYGGAVSTLSPHLIKTLNEADLCDVFTGGRTPIPIFGGRVDDAAVSPYTEQLYLLATPASGDRQVQTYSFPQLAPVRAVNTTASDQIDPLGVISVLGKEYLVARGDQLVNVADGRSSTVMPALGSDGRKRLRVYDDGKTLVGFYEDTGKPVASGYRHWARSANASCSAAPNNNQLLFSCADESGTYLTLPPFVDADFLAGPFFMPQGGFFFNQIQSGSPDYAFSAAGTPIPLLDEIRAVGDGAWQLSDTLIIDNFGGNALNYLFEPKPPAADLGELPQSSAVCPSPAGSVIAALSFGAQTLVTDPVRDLLYAPVSGPGAYAGELVTLSGSTGAVLHHVALGGSPALADINADASKLWVATRDPDKLFGIDLTGAEPVVKEALVLPTFDEQAHNYPTDLAVGSGTRDTVAVSLSGSSGVSGSVLLFIDGILRDTARMPAYEVESGPFGLFFASGDVTGDATRLLRVDDRHLNLLGKVADRTSGLRYQNGYLLAQTREHGLLFDARDPSAPKLLGTLPLANAMLPDVPHGRIWSLSVDSTSAHPAQLTAHDLEQLTLVGTTYLDGFAPGYPRDFVRTQSGCFAYVSTSYDATTLVVFAPPN